MLNYSRGKGETFRHITWNVEKRKLELSVKSSPELQTHTSRYTPSSPPGCLLYFSSLQRPPHFSLSVYSQHRARMILWESQPIISERNIILYVNYTYTKTQIMLLLSQNISSGFLSLSEKAKVIAVDSKSCMVFVPIWLQSFPSSLLHQLTGPHEVSQICQTPLYLRALCIVSVWSIQMST